MNAFLSKRTGRRIGPLLVLAMALGACKEVKVTDVPVDVDRIDLNATTVSLTVGGSTTVQGVAKSESGKSLTARTLTWTTSNAQVASVNNGTITGVSAGNATITARSGDASADISVTVVAVPRIGLSSATIRFDALQSGPNPAAQAVTVTNIASGQLIGITTGTIQYTAGQPSNWLVANIDRSTAPAVITLVASTGNLAPGTYTANVPVIAAIADNSPRTIAVTFVVSTSHQLTVNGGGTGSGTVTGAGINCTITNGAASGTCSVLVASGASVTLTATPISGHTFNTFTGCTPSGNMCTFAMTANRAVTVAFNPPGNTLTVTGAGNGNGTVTGGGLNCTIVSSVTSGICQVVLAVNSSVQIVATPVPGHALTGWAGACSTSASSCTIIMSQNRAVTANFNIIPPTAPTLSAGLFTVLAVNAAQCATVNNGSLIEYVFAFTDPNGNVTPGTAIINVDWSFQPAGASGTLQANGEYTGTGFNGTIRFSLCTAFGMATQTTNVIRLIDDGGLASNPLTAIVPKPIGSNESGLGIGVGGGASSAPASAARRRSGN